MRYGTADLHVHTRDSDGTAPVPAVLAQAAALGLDLVAITDHDTLRGALAARRIAHHWGVEVIVGEEVSTRDGHVLALFIEQELPPHRPAAETIAAIHAQGGLCVAAHPYDWASASLAQSWSRARGTSPAHDHPWHTWQVDALEAFNASLAWPRTGCNRLAQHVAQVLQLPAIGGSDAHSLSTIGRGYTRFPGRTADDLRRAIIGNTASWQGTGWTAANYLEIGWLSVRQRSLRGAVAWALADLPLIYARHKQRARWAATHTQPSPDVDAHAGGRS